jgi:hypothetical protein
MPPGTHVLVARQGQWLPASIVQPQPEGRFLIHYDGTSDQWNEVVGLDRIKTVSGGAPGAPGVQAGPPKDYRPGEKVLVTYQNRLLLADVVLQVSAETWRVHYDGFGPEAAENVAFERMRRPFSGPSGHAVGEALVVEANGQAMPAKVIAVSAADHWIVRFDGFGPEYDQEVGVERIRAGTPLAAPPPAASAAPPPAPPAAPPAPAKPEPPAPPAKAEKPKPAAEVGPAAQSGPPVASETVLVNAHGAYFAATVTGPGANGAFKIKFASGGEDEVPLDRIVREPATTKGLHYQVAQLVLVDFKGVWMPGKVLKQEGKAEYRVRFEGQGPEGDEVVTFKRIRPR